MRGDNTRSRITDPVRSLTWAIILSDWSVLITNNGLGSKDGHGIGCKGNKMAMGPLLFGDSWLDYLQ